MEPQKPENTEIQILKDKSGFPFDPLNNENDPNKMPIGKPIGTGVPDPDEALKKLKNENSGSNGFGNSELEKGI